MAATTYVSGVWKAATGTLQDLIDELKGDGIVDASRIAGIAHDGTNFAIIYRYK